MIDARKPKLAVITAGNNSTGMHSVQIGEGLASIPNVPSFFPAEQYFEGMAVILGFMNNLTDCPMILSHGFLAPTMAGGEIVFPPIPPVPPFPDGDIHFRLVESINIVEIIVYDYNIFPYPHAFYAEWYYWFEYFADAIPAGFWKAVSSEVLSGWKGKTATPDQWRWEIYNSWHSVGYSYFTSNWEDLSGAYYPQYNTEYEIQNYLQNQIQSYMDSGETDPNNLMTYYKDLSKSCYVDQWNAAFPGTFSETPP